MPLDFAKAAQEGSDTRDMAIQRQRRGAADILLLSAWVYGYGALIRFFGALQRVERLVSSSKRVDAK
jgi:hypothetical protein